MLKFLLIVILFTLHPTMAYDYYGNFYQECDNLNTEFTSRITRHTKTYCTPNGYTWPYCLDSYKKRKVTCSPSDFNKMPNLIEIMENNDIIYKGYYKSQSDAENLHPICFLASTALGRQSWNNDEKKDLCKKPENNNPRPNYRYYHCDDSESSQIKEHMKFYQCSSSSDKPCLKTPSNIKTIPGRPPCASQEYIHKITKAFNEVANCFDFKTQKEKEMIFSLLHHESRFLLNKIEQSRKEQRTFRCFGQINNSFISTLNQYIYFGDRKLAGTNKPHAKKFFEYGDIYKKAIKKMSFFRKSFYSKT